MKELIEVFKMNEISIEARCNIIIKLGRAIDDQMGMNITKPIVLELVEQLKLQPKVSVSDEEIKELFFDFAGDLQIIDYSKQTERAEQYVSKLRTIFSNQLNPK